MSDASQPSELVTPGFHTSTVQLVRAVTTYNDHFLLAFFLFWLVKLGSGQPQWLTGMH